MVHLTAGNSFFMPTGIRKWSVKPRSFMNSNTDCDHGYIHFAPMCSSQKIYICINETLLWDGGVVMMHTYFSTMSKRMNFSLVNLV